MTELEDKIIEKALEKINIEELIKKIGLDELTDKIAEKAAEMIVKKEYPDQPIIQPTNPWIKPWTTEPHPINPITVMYGCPSDIGYKTYTAEDIKHTVIADSEK